MSAKPRMVRVKVEAEQCRIEVSCAWGSSEIRFSEDYAGNGSLRQAVIVIKDPYDLRQIRDELDKIEAGWRRRIEALAS